MNTQEQDKTRPYVDDIFKERNIMKQKQMDIQNNIKCAIDDTDTQIRKLKNKIESLETKKKTLIIEYNKECNINDRIRGTTPPKTNLHIDTKIAQLSPKTEMIQNHNKDIEYIKKQLDSNNFKSIVEHMMENKLKSIETEKNNKTSICDIM